MPLFSKQQNHQHFHITSVECVKIKYNVYLPATVQCSANSITNNAKHPA
jgi:hypothetical protein